MRSLFRTIIAGALGTALPGAMLVALPLDQPGAAVLGASDEPSRTPAFFTGRLDEAEPCAQNQDGVEEFGDGVRKVRGTVFGCFTWVTTDLRLDGQSTVVWNWDSHAASGDVPEGDIQRGRERIVTETGSWEGTLTHLRVGDGLRLESGWYVGAGEYEGLVAYVTLQDNGRSLWGYISPEPPPVPETVP